MSECCSTVENKTPHPKKHLCPANGVEYAEVSTRTIALHIKGAWEWSPTSDRYFFCDDAACDVVYFGEDGSTILKSQLRTKVGAKENSGDKLLCYCFGVSLNDFQCNPLIKEFVIAKTKDGLCSCDTSNPSGRCCLKDFPKTIN